MADITFGHQAEHHSPHHHRPSRPVALSGHPAHGAYGAYSPDEMNRVHWQWHQRALQRIRTAMQRHNIWAPWVPGLPGTRLRPPATTVPRAPAAPRPAARRTSPGRHQGPPPGVGSPSGTYRSPLRLFAPRRDQGSPHTPGVHGSTPERHQETRNPGRSQRRSRTLPPAAQRVVFHEGIDRGHGGPNDPNAQHTSPATNPRRWSKRPRTERVHIPTFPTTAEQEQQAALDTDPHQAADGRSNSSAASLPGSADGPLRGGQHATGTRPRATAADQRPEQGVGGKTPQHPPPRAGRDETGPAHGHRPPDQLGPTPRGSSPQLQHCQTAEEQRTHRDNGSTTRAAQERTKK